MMADIGMNSVQLWDGGVFFWVGGDAFMGGETTQKGLTALQRSRDGEEKGFGRMVIGWRWKGG
jgi:hypothetical protein